MAVPRRETSIDRRIKPKYETKNHEIVAGLREAAGAGPPMDPYKVAKRQAAQLSATMALLHGGDWTVQMDHDFRLVVIRPV